MASFAVLGTPSLIRENEYPSQSEGMKVCRQGDR